MTNDFEAEGLPPRSWIDAFPWLPAVTESGTPPWWHEPIEDAGIMDRRERFATVSNLALERLTRWKISQIFPGLPPEVDLRSLQLPTRATNTLGREKCRVGADLYNVTLDEMLDWRQIGVSTVDDILQVLAEAATWGATPPVTNERDAIGLQLRPLDTSSQRFSSIVDDLKEIARWYVMLGVPDHRLLEQQLPAGAPAEVVKARQRVKDLNAGDILPADELAVDVAQLFDEALALLDPRARQILSDRLFADEVVTLEGLGRRHNVTRERVRQIEGKARGSMLSIISENGPLAALAEAARAQIGLILPLDELLKRIPSLGKCVQSVDQPAWRVLDRLDDAYEIENGWCVVPTMNAAEEMTQTHLQEKSDQYGVACLEDLALIEVEEVERRNELTAAWLAQCGYIVDRGFVLTRTQSIGDYAAAVLSLAGTPLAAQEILDQFVFERSAGSLRNAMGLDNRFERVDRDRWALTEWGMEAYSGIRSLIREQLAQNAGRVSLNDLIERITGRYSVSASSVIAYASSPPFAQRDGIVRLAGTDRESKKAPRRTRRLFRRAGAWAYRIRITKDHLRGSGSVAPMGIANILDLQFGQTRQLASPLGPQAVAWTGTQPSFGTIRRFLMDQDISAGTDAFLVIHDDGTFSFEAARVATGNPLLDALSLIGAPVISDREAAWTAISTAVELPETTPFTSVIGTYRERGDSDIADLLINARDYLETGQPLHQTKHHTDIDDILDLL